MTTKIAGFCGIYLNQPVPSNVKLSFHSPQLVLHCFDLFGCISADIVNVPKSFMSYCDYRVDLIPNSYEISKYLNDKNNKESLNDDAYMRALKVGGINASRKYEVYNDDREYKLPFVEDLYFENVTSLFYKTKEYLNNKFKTIGREDVIDASDGNFKNMEINYHYTLDNNYILLTLQTAESKGSYENFYKSYSTSIFVYDLSFYNYLDNYETIKQNEDEDAFM